MKVSKLEIVKIKRSLDKTRKDSNKTLYSFFINRPFHGLTRLEFQRMYGNFAGFQPLQEGLTVAYSRFSHDVTTAMLVPLNKEKAAMLVPRPNPPGI